MRDIRKNLMLVIDSLSGGGSELVVSNLCKYVDKKTFNVVVCCLKELGERGLELKKKGYNVELLDLKRNTVKKYLRWHPLLDLIKKYNIHLIHSHSTGSLFDSAVAKIVNRGVKHVHTFHFGNYPHVGKRILMLEKLFLKVPDKLVAVGIEQRKIISGVFRLPCKNIEIIWNGIEIQESGNARRWETSGRGPHDKKVIGSISTLTEQKGISYLLDAIALLSRRNKDFELWIFGDGPLRTQLEFKSRHLGLDNVVKFAGWVHNASTAIFPKIDIFVQSSLWEAMSMVVLEAMAAGKPVVATDVGDNMHIMNRGKAAGIIVPKNDPQKMAYELERLILDKSLCETLVKNAWEKVFSECTVQIMTKKYERLYLDLLGEKS